MSPFMLLIAIMWFEYVIAKNTLIGGATVGIVFVGNELMISIRAAMATALRAWDLRFSYKSRDELFFWNKKLRVGLVLGSTENFCNFAEVPY